MRHISSPASAVVQPRVFASRAPSRQRLATMAKTLSTNGIAKRLSSVGSTLTNDERREALANLQKWIRENPRYVSILWRLCVSGTVSLLEKASHREMIPDCNNRLHSSSKTLKVKWLKKSEARRLGLETCRAEDRRRQLVLLHTVRAAGHRHHHRLRRRAHVGLPLQARGNGRPGALAEVQGDRRGGLGHLGRVGFEEGRSCGSLGSHSTPSFWYRGGFVRGGSYHICVSFGRLHTRAPLADSLDIPLEYCGL